MAQLYNRHGKGTTEDLKATGREMGSRRTFRLTEMEIADLSAVDLWARAEEITDGHAYLITIFDDTGIHPEAETAQALFSYGRLGIAWGADATWADVESLETGVEMWLNNPGEWDRG